jgi:hypothetical protein
MAPTMAATSSSQGLISASIASALTATMRV